MPRTGAATSRDHAVLFYDHVPRAVDALADYTADGLRRGDSVLAVLTPAHAASVRAALGAADLEPARAEAEGRLAVLDVATTLGTFLVGGAPDLRLMREGLGSVLEELAARGRPIRAMGEMVAALWEEGNVTGALALEAAWNELADSFGLSLLCPYPSSVLEAGALAPVGRLCSLHSDVVAPEAYASGPVGEEVGPGATSGVFVPTPEAVGATRRLVAAAMADCSVSRGLLVDDRLVADACLVASEMAANAVTHAHSAFEVAVACTDRSVRVMVSDIGPGTAQEQHAGVLDAGGRGLTIVAEVADRWGCDLAPGGKVVWAELLAGHRFAR